jgi:hypothetical protein
MKEIWRMWRMVRLLAKNRFEFALYSIKTQAAITSHKLTGATGLGENEDNSVFQAEILRGVVQHHREPRVLRQTLCNEYVFTQWPYLKKRTLTNGGMGEEIYQEKFLEAEAIINSCICHKPQFMKTEGSGTEQVVYLTIDGKKFASWEGSLRAFRPLIEELTAWKQLLIGTGIGGIIIGGIWVIISHI